VSTADLTTRTVRLALRAICCARCSGIVPPDHAERTERGHWRCRDFADCRYRREQHRRIADELRRPEGTRSDDAGRGVAA